MQTPPFRVGEKGAFFCVPSALPGGEGIDGFAVGESPSPAVKSMASAIRQAGSLHRFADSLPVEGFKGRPTVKGLSQM